MRCAEVTSRRDEVFIKLAKDEFYARNPASASILTSRLLRADTAASSARPVGTACIFMLRKHSATTHTQHQQCRSEGVCARCAVESCRSDPRPTGNEHSLQNDVSASWESRPIQFNVRDDADNGQCGLSIESSHYSDIAGSSNSHHATSLLPSSRVCAVRSPDPGPGIQASDLDLLATVGHLVGHQFHCIPSTPKYRSKNAELIIKEVDRSE